MVNKGVVKEYLDYYKEYSKKYNKIAILYQKGSFYEIYGTNEEGNAKEIAEILNIQISRENKNINEISRSNALLCGIPVFSKDRHIEYLLDNEYTVILIDQIEQKDKRKKIERKVSGILRKSMYIDSINNNENKIVSIYIEKNKYKKGYSLGLSNINLINSKNSISEFYSENKNYIVNKIYEYIETNQPQDIVLLIRNTSIEEMEVEFEYIEFKINDEYFKIDYQNELLSKIFKNDSILTTIELLNLEKYQIGTISYIILLQFIYEHDPLVLKKIEKPNFIKDENRLILDYNTINQLNLVDNNKLELGNNVGKYKSIIDVVNNTTTIMGERLLKEYIMKPINNKEELSRRYGLIEKMIEGNKIKEIENILNGMKDLDKIKKKIVMRNLNPSDLFYYIDIAKICINKIDIMMMDIDCKINVNECEVLDFYRFCENNFNDNLANNNIYDIKSNFFERNVYKEIDKISDEMNIIYNKIENKCEELCKIIGIKDSVKIMNNEKEGYYFITSNSRCKKIKEKNGKEYEFKTQTNSTKINNNEIRELSNEYIKINEKFKEMMKKKYIEKLEEIDENFDNVMYNINRFISEIDFYKSCAKTSIKFNYCKPEIDMESEDVYIRSDNMRHPLVERINKDEMYVPNDIIINKENNGKIIYGLNACGKTTLMKSIGVNLILAQSGMYTSCKSFKYVPYNKIMTRITGNDNIYKGQSTFAVEMNELNNIIRNSDKETLVIGDEICKGTDPESGAGIVCATIKYLSENGINFVFSSHLHNITRIKEIKEIDNLGIYHLSVEKGEDGKIKYNRKLKEGCGDSYYGIEVAKIMGMKDNIIRDSIKFRRKLIDESEELMISKVSRYNRRVYMDRCMTCNGKAEDTHHINFQCNSDKNGFFSKEDGKEHVYKHDKYNLVTLCRACHIKIHKNKII